MTSNRTHSLQCQSESEDPSFCGPRGEGVRLRCPRSSTVEIPEHPRRVAVWIMVIRRGMPRKASRKSLVTPNAHHFTAATSGEAHFGVTFYVHAKAAPLCVCEVMGV